MKPTFVMALALALTALAACAESPDPELPPTEPAAAATQATCAIGTCAHAPGATGVALGGACSTCTTAVCAADPYCCTTTWDQQCVEESARRCGCEPQPFDESADAPVTAIDLNGDGTVEALSTATCASGTGHCVRVDSGSPSLAGRQILLDATGKACPLQAGGGYPIKGRRFQALGDLVGGDGVSELSVLYCGASNQPALAVVNVAGSALLGRALAPVGQKKAYVDAVRDPSGRLYPFLAPPLGDGDTTAPIWGYLCQYRPGQSSAGCGSGFQQITTSFAGSYRDAGGTLADENGDGWTDLNLIYHATIRTYSGANGALLATTSFDPAAAASQVINPGETGPVLTPINFHSGRLYGVHGAGRTVQPALNGKQRIAIVAGNEVGDFQDPDCNVSRFVAVLQHPPGSPATRTLKWSRYYGFSVHNLSADCNTVLRTTDKLNGCVHRFSDARVLVDGSEALAFNVSTQATATTCLAEQQQVCRTNFSQAALDAQFACQSLWLHQPASWTVRVVNENSGTAVASLPGRYLWGYSDRLVPGQTVYLTATVPAGATFDQPGQVAPVLQAHTLSGAAFNLLGSFPVAGRPLIRRVRPAGQRGVGSSTSLAELTLVDTALGVGVRLDDAAGSVVAWNGTGFVVACTGTSCTPSPCTFAVSPAAASIAAGGGSGAVAVTTGAGCAWTASSNAAWVTVSGGGSGNGSASYSVAANPGAARSATLTVAGTSVVISQAAGSASCTPSPNSCCQACGGYAGACYCDAVCSQYGDCCADKAAVCQ